jgi:hypothetical protein
MHKSLVASNISSSNSSTTTTPDDEVNVVKDAIMINNDDKVIIVTPDCGDHVNNDFSDINKNHDSSYGTDKNQGTDKLSPVRSSARLRNKLSSNRKMHDTVDVTYKTIDVVKNHHHHHIDPINNDINEKNKKLDSIPLVRSSSRLRNNLSSNNQNTNSKMHDTVDVFKTVCLSFGGISESSYDKPNSLVPVEHATNTLKMYNCLMKAQAKLVDDWNVCPSYSLFLIQDFINEIRIKHLYNVSIHDCNQFTLLCNLIVCSDKNTIHNINRNHFLMDEVSVYVLFIPRYKIVIFKYAYIVGVFP